MLKTFKPITPSLRQCRILSRDILHKIKPLKSQTIKYQYKKGRNNIGCITIGSLGGGHKKIYRNLDFYRKNDQGIVEGLEYDPNRTSWIVRAFHPDRIFHSYILGVKDLKTGSCLRSFNHTKLSFGHHLSLKDLPEGFVIHNLSENDNKKGQYLRAAGTFGILVLKTRTHAQIKLRSGEHRIFSLKANASLGAVNNENIRFVNYGKAGRKRWYGIRPTVRGVAINPVDHPHGGGEGKTSGGRPSVTPWGKCTKGQPTAKYINPLRVTYRKRK